MAVDIFMKIGDIKGESTDHKHAGEIEVLSWSWGVSNSGTMAHGSGGGEGKASFNDFSFATKISKASPLLMKACAAGSHIKEATITFRKSGERQFEFLVYKLTDVLVHSFQTAGSTQDIPSEEISLTFQTVNVDYKPQNPDGSAGAAVHFGWDLRAHRPI
jgi:type VI secretion system secreted protein Hcp